MRTYSACLGLAVATMAALLSFPSPAGAGTIVPRGSEWKYLDDGSNQGTAWRVRAFNDSSWSSGLAELGYGDGGEITPVGYGSDANNKYITTYFRKLFTVADPAAYGTLVLTLLRDDGAVVYLNGTEIRRDGLPGGEITYTTPANITVSGADETTFYPSNVSAALLVAGTNILAVEIHQVNGPSSDISFDLELKAPTPPLVALSSPAQGAVYGIETPIELAAAVTDDSGVARVEFYRGALKLGEAYLPPYSLLWTNQTEGSWALTATAWNVDGLSAVSAPVNILVTDTNLPALVSALASSNTVQVNFSKALDPASATNTANYSLSGGAPVLGAVLGMAGKRVTLTTAPLTVGASCTVFVKDILDTSGHALPPGAETSFTILPYAAADIGGIATPVSVSPTGAGYLITANGTDIGGGADSFSFFYQAVSGDFDYQTRVAGVSLSDVWAKAGLMARESVEPGSRFAAALASPSVNGCFFASRGATNGAAAFSGSLPVNYPYTWLRLKRAGSAFTAYAGHDGRTWCQLGSATITAPASLLVGFAVSSHSATKTATAQFQDFGDSTGGTVLANYPLAAEPPGPASRNTGLVFSEVMYHPRHSNDLEFVEIFNSAIFPEDLSSYRITGSIHYTFPTNTVLPSGGYLVVARKPGLLQQACGISGVHGPWVGAETNALPDDQGALRLWNRNNGMALELNYKGIPPWPLAADGAGHSLVLARPSYGQDDVRAWEASDQIGGSPGRMDPLGPEPLRNVVVNEFLANSDAPDQDYIELYNHSALAADLSGAWLSDQRDTNIFRIPDATLLAPRGFLVFQESQLGFALRSRGGRIYLVNSNQTRVLEALDYQGTAAGIASGRYPDGAPDIHELKSRTPGATNDAGLLRDIVINEIMFNPPSGNDDDQFIELYNRAATPVNISAWRLTEGVTFTFPSNTVIPARGFLVTGRNAARLQASYPHLNAANLTGDFNGALAHNGERLALAMPEPILDTNAQGAPVTNINWVIVAEANYRNAGRWSQWADGGGSSLELLDPNSDPRLGANWADSDETSKSDWTNVSYTALIDNVFPIAGNGPLLNEFQVLMLSAGECLMDDASVRYGRGGPTNANWIANSDFNTGLAGWLIQGNHVRSGLEPVGPGNPTTALRIRASSGGDNGANRVECDLTGALNPGSNATLSARFRWLRGDPQVLMRLHGGGLEASFALPIPANLGTPGLPNSRLLTNAGPAVYDVVHSPVSPAAGQQVVVTARASDPDGVALVQLLYRVEPNTTATALTMRDDGLGGDAVAGDGLYSVTMPGQAAGAIVAFRVSATDGRSATALFPPDAPVHECLVRFGDPAGSPSVPSYRLWVSSASMTQWSTRERLSNEPVDGTLAINDYRVIYNSNARYRGSPFIRGGGPVSPTGATMMFIIGTPEDEPFLGETEFNLDSLEHGGRDSTGLREPMAFWLVNQMGLPFTYQRPIHIVINGVSDTSRGVPGYIDVQQPNSSYVNMWFAGRNRGDLFKIDDWFEYDDVVAMQANKSASLEVFNTTNLTVVTKKQARYRWSWEKKANKGVNDDYSAIFAMADALNAPDAIYPRQVDSVIESDEWMTMFAIRHVLGDWDGYGYRRGKNEFVYHPQDGKTWMILWDLDFSFGCTGGDGPTADLFSLSVGGATASDSMPEISRMYNHPRFRRAYFQALQRIADGPLAESVFGARLDACNQAFLANSINAVSPYIASGAQSISIPEWARQRRVYIYQQLAAYTSTGFTVAAPSTSASNLVTLTGSAPLSVLFLRVNGRDYPITWTSVTAWSVQIPLVPGGNDLNVQAFDGAGNPLAGMTSYKSVTYAGAEPSPAGLVIINEIMFDPLVPGAEYVELFNSSATQAFDLAGWQFNGLSYTFPSNAFLPPRSYMVLAKDRLTFATAYGGALPVFDVFPGNLQANGETLSLIKPASGAAPQLLVDEVRYTPQSPWPGNTAGTGSSAQLVDTAQDNSRPVNWWSRYTPGVYLPGIKTDPYTNSGWRFTSVTGNAIASNVLIVFLNAPVVNNGVAWIDDLYLVSGSNAAVGPNYISAAGDFEPATLGDTPWPRQTNIFFNPTPGTWFISTNYAGTDLSTDTAHSGGVSLRLNAKVSGNTPGTPTTANKILYQRLMPDRPTNKEPCTLSFWFLTSETPAVTNLTVRIISSALSIITNILPQFVPGTNIPPTLLAPPVLSATPGAPNALTTNLPAIPPLWINEIQPANLAGPADQSGLREPWIELYNSGPSSVSLEGLYLTDSLSDPLNWAFPSGASLAAGEFRVLFADGQPAQTTASEWHTRFRLAPSTGMVALVRLNAGSPEVLDFLQYESVPQDRSFGSFPDGQLVHRQPFFYPTPGATNDASSPPLTVFVNEWMAANTSFIPDPVGGKFDDWFELYNPSDLPQDLSGFYLTDTLDTPRLYLIPAGYVVPPRGFLLVWADGKPERNSPADPALHAGFQLAKDGEAIALLGADGRVVDVVHFGPQTNNISQGRLPDGSSGILFMPLPTPGQPNRTEGGNLPPVVAAIASQALYPGQLLSLTATAYDPNSPPQEVIFSLDPGSPAGASIEPRSGLLTWTPLPEFAGMTLTIQVRATDNGFPPLSGVRSFEVYVRTNSPAVLTFDAAGLNNSRLTLLWPSVPGLHYQILYKTNLADRDWTLLEEVQAAGELTSRDLNTALEPQRFYRVKTL